MFSEKMLLKSFSLLFWYHSDLSIDSIFIEQSKKCATKMPEIADLVA
jgi:hypothetical protein